MNIIEIEKTTEFKILKQKCLFFSLQITSFNMAKEIIS